MKCSLMIKYTSFFFLYAAALSDDKKLASRCCDVLVEALSLYPQQVPVWLNALYAILQILSSNSESVMLDHQVIVFTQYLLSYYSIRNHARVSGKE